MAGDLAPTSRSALGADDVQLQMLDPSTLKNTGPAPATPVIPVAQKSSTVDEFFGGPAQSAQPAAQKAAAPAKPAAQKTSTVDEFFGAPNAKPSAPSLEQRTTKISRLFAGRDPDVDYAKGAPWNVQLALKRADNPDEAAAMLERRVGAENYGQDKRGNWWIIDGGQKVAVVPEAGLSGQGVKNAVNNFGVSAVASAPTFAGAIGGGLAGGLAGGPPGAIIGAGLGAAGGKALDKGEKLIEGTQRGSPAQMGADIVKEGAINGALQGVGPVAGQIGRKAGSFVRDFVETTPQTRAQTARLVDEGFTPPLMSAAPGAKLMQFDQKMRNLIKGDPYEKKNIGLLFDRARSILASEGMQAEEIDNVMAEATGQDSRMSGSAVGQGLANAAQTRLGDMRAEAETLNNIIRSASADAEQQLMALGSLPRGRLGAEVEQAISDSRSEFSDKFSAAYAAIDRMAGNARIIPVGPMRQMAIDLKMITAPSEWAPILDDLANADAKTTLTFREAHDIRSMFREISRSKHKNLTPSIKAHKALLNAQRADEMLTGETPLEDLADLGDSLDFADYAELNGVPPEAIAELRRVDAAYKEGIAKYYNATINQLVKDAEDGIFADPAIVAAKIVKPGYTEQTREIMRLLPPEMRAQVARADAYNLIRQLTNNRTGKIEGGLLRVALNDPSRRAVMDLVYPPQVLARFRQLADELAALNGDVDVREIRDFSAPGVEQAMTTALAKARDIEQFTRTNVVRHLADPDPQVVDAAADHILSGGKELNLQAVRDFLGESSKEWKALKLYALKKVFREAVVETPTQSKAIEGEAIDEILRRWTPAEQDLLFPEGLREDVRELAKDAKFVFPNEMNDSGSSIQAGNIKSQTWTHIRATMRYLEYWGIGWLVARPGFLRFLADANRENPTVGKALLAAMIRYGANAAMQGPGNEQPNPSIPNIGAEP